jgi:hypothetical protein
VTAGRTEKVSEKERNFRRVSEHQKTKKNTTTAQQPSKLLLAVFWLCVVSSCWYNTKQAQCILYCLAVVCYPKDTLSIITFILIISYTTQHT